MGIQKCKEASVWGKAVGACVPPGPRGEQPEAGRWLRSRWAISEGPLLPLALISPMELGTSSLVVLRVYRGQISREGKGA